MSITLHENNNDMSLSIDFAKEISSSRVFNTNDINFDPILQTLDTWTKFRNLSLSTSKHTHKLVPLQVKDPNGCCLNMKKVASQLNGVSGNFTVVTVIKRYGLNFYNTNVKEIYHRTPSSYAQI